MPPPTNDARDLAGGPGAGTAGRPSRESAGFLSSARSFFLPVGPDIGAGEVRGYYIDLRVKAGEPSWPPASLAPETEPLWVDVAQWGLGAYERYLAREGEQWLAAAVAVGEELLRRQERGGARDGGWLHARPFPHTFRLHPNWLSGMAQGEGASLLVRLRLATGEEGFAEAARRALGPLSVPTSEGGVQALLDGSPLPEEYPTEPPSFVLNGAIFALWGLYDVGVALGHRESMQAFEEGVDALAKNLHRWDTGYWSRYDLAPHPVVNVASSFYHSLHVNQLEALNRIAPRPELEEGRARFEAYAQSRANRWRAFGRKAVFRMVVPRNKLLARRLPWTRTPRRRPAARD
jgi:heparosan-N-sulfate-glucuronate 5-epimerase